MGISASPVASISSSHSPAVMFESSAKKLMLAISFGVALGFFCFYIYTHYSLIDQETYYHRYITLADARDGSPIFIFYLLSNLIGLQAFQAFSILSGFFGFLYSYLLLINGWGIVPALLTFFCGYYPLFIALIPQDLKLAISLFLIALILTKTGGSKFLSSLSILAAILAHIQMLMMIPYAFLLSHRERLSIMYLYKFLKPRASFFYLAAFTICIVSSFTLINEVIYRTKFYTEIYVQSASYIQGFLFISFALFYLYIIRPHYSFGIISVFPLLVVGFYLNWFGRVNLLLYLLITISSPPYTITKLINFRSQKLFWLAFVMLFFTLFRLLPFLNSILIGNGGEIF